MKRLEIADAPIEGVKVITRRTVVDERGHFGRIFCTEELAEAGWRAPVAQVNESFTRRRGSLRGMHFQSPPHADFKLVTCLRGEVLDIALDLRAGSDTLLRWHAEVLSEDNQRALLLPPGCAHGFQTLTDDVQLVYCHSHVYAPQSDDGINPFDPQAAIEWPLEPVDMSTRDRQRPLLSQAYRGIAF